MTGDERDGVAWAVLLASCAVSVLTLIFVRELIRAAHITNTPDIPTTPLISTSPVVAGFETATPAAPLISTRNGEAPASLLPPEPTAFERREAQEAARRLFDSPQTNKTALRLLLEGKHRPEYIARQTGASVSTVRRYDLVLRKAGVNTRQVRQRARRIENS